MTAESMSADEGARRDGSALSEGLGLAPERDELRLLPCPFCGAGQTLFQDNGRMWTGVKLSEPVSVSVRHWCDDEPGQPNRMIERIGRDRESAIAAWNKRA